MNSNTSPPTIKHDKRVNPEKLISLQQKTSKIRNICILAHVDHGKTTLSDSLVCSNGIISDKLAGKLRFLDSSEDEQKRGITMHSSAISLMYRMEKRRGVHVPPETQQLNLSKESSPAGLTQATEFKGGLIEKDISGDGTSQDSSPEFEEHLINLIDSPGHIDFSSDVSTATRLCDGALVVVDVIEGVCIQTHAVLRQAWVERMRPCLVLNKLDRLITELKLSPLEAFNHLRRVLENINAVAASLVSNEALAQSTASLSMEQGSIECPEDDVACDLTKYGQPTINELESWWEFCPEKGNVVFASAAHTWAFGLRPFARIWAQKIGCKVRPLMKMMWGDYTFNKKTKKVVRLMPEDQAKPLFVSMILEPIWQLYQVALVDRDVDKATSMCTKLGLDIPRKELSAKDYSPVQSIFRRWLPLADAVLCMVVEVIPAPNEAQRFRAPAIWATDLLPEERAGMPPQSPELADSIKSVYESVARCDTSEQAPVVVFVSKMVPMRRSELKAVDPFFNTPQADEDEQSMDDEIFIAFARIFSGTLARTSNLSLSVLGPKYHPVREFSGRYITHLSPDLTLPLFLMMGNGLLPVQRIYAGNIVAIAGLGRHIFKCGTLSSTPACPGFKAIKLQAQPMVRVAVEAVNQRDISALEKGLQKLYQADPAVEVTITESGEHIIAALGELHMEQCIKDLRERYAGVELVSSQPIVTFRESLSFFPEEIPKDFKVSQLNIHPWMDLPEVNNTACGKVRVVVPSRECAITLKCLPMPAAAAKLLDEHAAEAKHFVSHLHRAKTNPVNQLNTDTLDEEAQDFCTKFQEALDNEAPESLVSRNALELLICFGPKSNGPNMLLRSPEISFIGIAGVLPDEKNPDVESLVQEPIEISPEAAWSCVGGSIKAGFQMATSAGPLMEEPMYGVCFVVETIELSVSYLLGFQNSTGIQNQPQLAHFESQTFGENHSVSSEHSEKISDFSGWGHEKSNPHGPISGQIISSVKDGCRAAFISCPARLVEAYYCCELQCDQLQLGNMYAVLSKRRGKVFEEDIIEGTQLFILKAGLPVAESFGFANELLKKTSGAATTPQLAFSHWEIIDLDPFFRPTTEEEREDLGETIHEVNFARKYIDAARRRKGLASDKQIVVAAEKQRTLTRNK